MEKHRVYRGYLRIYKLKDKLKSILIGNVKLTESAIFSLRKKTNLVLIITKKDNGYNNDFLDIKKKI